MKRVVRRTLRDVRPQESNMSTCPNRFELFADRYRVATATLLAAFAMRSATAFGWDT